MKDIRWDSDKNNWLKRERNLSFEQVVVAIEQGGLLDIVLNLQSQYAHQKIFVVEIEGYAVLVPFVEEASYLFLKTAFHSRKATKHYLS